MPRRRWSPTHLLLAPRRGDAATVGVLRGRGAHARWLRGASDSAVALLRRALDEPPPLDTRADVLIELGLVETLVDGPASAAHLTEAYDLVEDPHERARIATLVVRTHVFASPPGVATAFALEAEAALPDGLDDDRQGAGRVATHHRRTCTASRPSLSLAGRPRR